MLAIGKSARKPSRAVAKKDHAEESGDELAAVLRRSNYVSDDLLERAEELQRQTGRGIGQTLLDMGVLSDEQLYAAYGELTGLPLWDSRGEITDADPFSTEFLIFNRVLPITVGSQRSFVIADPEDDGLIDMIRRLAPGAGIAIHPEDDLVYRLENHFDFKRDGDDREADDLSEVEHLKDLALEAPVIRKVNELITNGIKMGASDIHLEPFRNRIELRYRVDGVLHNRAAPTPGEYAAVVSRLKILSSLDIAERRLPQDGRFKIKTSGKDIDIRVSTIPTSSGEDVALRILDQKKQVLSLDSLGLTSEFARDLREVIRRSHGLILVTGPTGSGKTTTLYSGLTELIDGAKKIITVEDPVEDEIPGINQIQVNSEIKLTFASALRSILRHDPDVILVGEIRDHETAEIAIESALTGHLVLSTIHTNSAVGAIGRLLNMGLPDYLIASSLLAVTGQRLVRKLCGACQRRVTLDSALAERFNLPPDSAAFEAVGCPECGGIGYRGRMPIGEILIVDGRIRAAILSNPTNDSLVAEAKASGFRAMIEDGMKRVVASHTTVEEVFRVVR